tara:strand:- start:188 stop:1147 length:960 start_codon:yes stop_codon:yes gene_type:complete
MNKKNIPNISKQIYYQDTINVFINSYSQIGPQWTAYQMDWFNGIYLAFKDHEKYLIVVYLIKKTLDFYSRNFTKLTYDDFYSKDTVEIEKFNVIDIARDLNIPKESARRKIVELEKSSVIVRKNKKIILDRSAFPFVKPVNSIIRMSRFLSSLSTMLVDEKILSKPISSKDLEKIILDNFSYVWKLYYELQIPMMLNYKKIFGDIETFHIFGTCVVNQHLHLQTTTKNNKDRSEFLKSLYSNYEMPGVSAMSISDITGIPRATVVRKLKKLIKIKYLSIDKKKHYKLTGNFVKTLGPLQKTVLNSLSSFATAIFNLKLL